MKLDKQLFDKIAELAAESPRLRMHYDLRDSEDEQGQRMLNVLLPGTKSAIHRHRNTSEVVICIYGSAIERFYDEQGNQTEEITLTAGGGTPGVLIEKGKFHTIAATDSMAVVITTMAGKYNPAKNEYMKPQL